MHSEKGCYLRVFLPARSYVWSLVKYAPTRRRVRRRLSRDVQPLLGGRENLRFDDNGGAVHLGDPPLYDSDPPIYDSYRPRYDREAELDQNLSSTILLSCCDLGIVLIKKMLMFFLACCIVTN